ncbi:hypothetical protein SUGI_0143870 [Cryptomeria japonica]|nr:hypothetical protein SUGI_0143870 [Cryptomeria japonica]
MRPLQRSSLPSGVYATFHSSAVGSHRRRQSPSFVASVNKAGEIMDECLDVLQLLPWVKLHLAQMVFGREEILVSLPR